MTGRPVGIGLGLTTLPAIAADTGDAIDGWAMSIEVLGGLSLFLFGMGQMANALKVVSGDRMKQVLARLTGDRLAGLATGAFITSVIQSSSVTTVMLVGFVSAGLMSFRQTVGVILGADIGTTITAQIVAFRITEYALLPVAGGFLLVFTGRRDSIRQYGHLLMGLGLIFFGMSLMSEAMAPLRSYAPFIDVMRQVSDPLTGILIGTAFTALIQSSSATMGVVIALAMQGLITLEGGIALTLGANIGTCVTAGLAALGKPREAVRVAAAHVAFKVVGVLLLVGFIPWFAELVRLLSPAAAGLSGADRLAADTPRQIANAHTVFNVGIAMLFLPVSNLFVRLCEWLVPDRPAEVEIEIRPRYLDDALLETPSLALDRVRLEIGHMGEHVEAMLARMPTAILSGNQESLREIARMDDDVDLLHGHVITYMGRISQRLLTENQTREFINLMRAANDLENIGDIIETDLVSLGQRRLATGVRISALTADVLKGLHGAVSEAVERALRAIAEHNPAIAQEVIGMKNRINHLVDSAALHEASRLVAEEPNRLATYRVEVDIIEKLKRIYYFAKRIAKAVTGEL